MKYFVLILSLCCLCNMAQATVQGKDVVYDADGLTLKGYIAYDDAIKGKRPAVIVVHEWWGQNEYVRMRARMLAELGYTAMAIDMYGDGKVTDDPLKAAKYANELNTNVDLEWLRFEAAMKLLSKHETVDADRMAAFGYCFGGGVVLNMARLGTDLKGVASFHGSLAMPMGKLFKPGHIKARVVSFSGEDDPIIGPDKVAAFKQEMDRAMSEKADYKVYTYPGAKHAFSNPESDAVGKKYNLPIAYNEKADKDSWEKATLFLREVFTKN
jgi:dienelactone hydrolase